MPNRGADAMVDCEAGEGDNCSHCQADENKNVYWDISLDQDLLQTILSYYPEWFKDYNMNLAVSSGGESDSENPVISLLHARELDGPVKNQIEHTSLQKSMEKNKESLKVKLMLRRPASQLADQGILPPLKTPPAFHEQRQKLERAKMGDLLKSKIQKRPDRKELVRQHILEESTADPNVQDKQRQLRKARLADGLNNQISRRPGPMDLVKGNILHVDDIVDQALREGSLALCNESEALSPSTKISFDEDSGSDGGFSPSPPYDFSEHSQSSLPPVEPIEPSPNCNDGSPGSIRTSFSLSPPSSVPSPMSIFPSVVSPLPQESVPEVLNNTQLQNKDTSKNNKKKTKPKTQQKARTIKFHEYKGPPNAQKNQPPPPPSTASTESSSYDRLLQQQQLFLQMQLEWQQQKYSQVTPTQKSNGDQSGNSNQSSVPLTQSGHSFELPSSPQKIVSKLEDLKVSDLKAELKKRNLPVSGSKPLLIERLKNYAELPQNASPISAAQNIPNITPQTPTSVDGGIPMCVESIMMDTSATPGIDITVPSVTISETANGSTTSTVNSLLLSVLNGGTQALKMQSPASMQVDIDCVPVNSGEVMDTSDSSSTSLSNEDIVQLQQRCIEKLQRELERSQMQLQQSFFCQQPTQSSVIASADCVPTAVSSSSVHSEPSAVSATTSASSSINGSVQTTTAEKLLQRQLIHQQLQQKIHQQQLQLQKQHSQEDEQGKVQVSAPQPSSPSANATLTALLKSQPMNSLPVSGGSLSSVENSLCSTTSEAVQVPTDNVAAKSFSGLDLIGHSNSPETPVLSTSVSTFPKPAIVTLNSGATNKRTSSLPSFSALVNNKPAPTRSHTDPHFFVTRPPPDYDEATRQKTKAKQPSIRSGDTNPRSSKKQKSSVKSQAVDDVLEILIKNGELPPSAAQDPSAPVTSNTCRNDNSSVSSAMFPSSGNSATKVTSNMNTISSTLMSSPITTPASAESSSLHLASLQSVLDMTPPSSAGLVEQNNSATSSLDFDFQFDVDDIDAMDIEVLTHSGSQSDPILSVNMQKDEKLKTAQTALNQPMGLSSSQLQSPELIDLQEKRMDTDLLDWLEVIDDSSVAPTSSSSSFHHPAYSIANDHDPLLSNMTSNHDSLDFFSTDDMDFKGANDLNLLLWDKPDFAT